MYCFWGMDVSQTYVECMAICHTFDHLAFHLMTPKNLTTIRLSDVQIRKIEKLAEKLAISKADVVRMAINRLAELEGIK
jgi:hypothetical protein